MVQRLTLVDVPVAVVMLVLVPMQGTWEMFPTLPVMLVRPRGDQGTLTWLA
jgi:hypothetical protein